MIWSLSVELFFSAPIGVATAAVGRLGLRPLFVVSLGRTLLATLSHAA